MTSRLHFLELFNVLYYLAPAITISHNHTASITTMAKKPRSQRRKKGSKLGEQEDEGGAAADVDAELLSESHTVADSMSTFDDFGT
jgi:hypothetical protein